MQDAYAFLHLSVIQLESLNRVKYVAPPIFELKPKCVRLHNHFEVKKRTVLRYKFKGKHSHCPLEGEFRLKFCK